MPRLGEYEVRLPPELNARGDLPAFIEVADDQPVRLGVLRQIRHRRWERLILQGFARLSSSSEFGFTYVVTPLGRGALVAYLEDYR